MKTTLKEIKNAIRAKVAQDITYTERNAIQEHLTNIAYSVGIYGVNGALFRGDESGTLYAITARTANLFYYL